MYLIIIGLVLGFLYVIFFIAEEDFIKLFSEGSLWLQSKILS